ncbi:hypothetical protein [Aeromicrobium sp. IC_218]|uniref:hypothetical protein n=1 Tax=Aeromicrobium sp. IC_218 TaxID=2545468 RepID=UPI0010388345|nr:hypothetical protein [Aeromicrobium sp. IC_218]TCI97690.1 hypothetical protein E0W78_11635 [Aeromicrobium sp. IC_218]
MMRRAALTVPALALAVLAACSGGTDTGTIPPATPTAPAPSASATPTPGDDDSGDADAEPDGSDGGTRDGSVEVRIQNGRKFADDPVVAQFRLLTSAIYRSINGGELVPELDDLGNEQVRDFVSRTVSVARDQGFTVPTDPLFRVAVSDGTQLKVCVRGDTQQFLDASGEPVNDSDRTWYRIVLTAEGAPDAVRFTSYEPEGTCRAS